MERTHIVLDRPRVLVFRHQDIRDAVNESGRSVGDLLGDPFVGWGQLLHKGLRYQDPKLTLNRTSELIDAWVEGGQTLEALGDKLVEALEASGFLKLKRMDESEGNATTPAMT